MAHFPALKTGALTQYPLTRRMEFGTGIVRFLAGDEQRYALRKTHLKQWSVSLELLTEEELQQLEDFFVSQQGRYGEFSFTDPWDGAVYDHCSFDADAVGASLREFFRGSTFLRIRQNWS